MLKLVLLAMIPFMGLLAFRETFATARHLPDGNHRSGVGGMMLHKSIWVLALAVVVSGCASILSGTDQTITITTNPPEAVCTLFREGFAVGQVTTPGGVVVEKTKHDLTIECTKPGYQTASGVLASEIEGATWGNIILGGPIGWAIDSASGADNEYSEHITITLVPDQ